MLDDIQHPELDFDSKHGPNQVANLIFSNVNKLYKDKIITDAQFININQDITDLTNICGACEPSLELIAEAIEDPFGTDTDDLPIEKIAINIKKHIGELI
ncbi:hypothetical protein FQR65_LT15502 [Abscondita terminalis]|nr:hypothetical protein FQR65_LT15502 [Abscondita terminalis]